MSDDTPFADLPLPLLRIVNDRCTNYEEDRKAGRVQPIDNYLCDLPDDQRTAVRAELLALQREHERLPPALGDYELLEVLGQGGMATVYLARHRQMGRAVAVKVLRPELAADAAAQSRFRREMRAAAAVTHSNVVLALDAGEADGRLFLVSEFVDGEDLRALVRRSGPVSPSRAVSYTVQAARGLAHAHSHGLIHRDVKPANLILGRDGVVRVLDLGLARFPRDESSDRTLPGVVLGTPAYVAPEQVTSAQTVDPRADVYALGGVLHFLLTGRPYREGLPDGKPLPLSVPNVPRRLTRVLSQMLADDPARRPGMADVERLLNRAIRPRIARWVVAGCAAVLIGALAIAYWPKSDPPGPVIPPVSKPPTATIVDLAKIEPAAYRDRWAHRLDLPVEVAGEFGILLMLIPPGFLDVRDFDGEREVIRHLQLDGPIYLAQTELTVGQMRSIVANSAFVSRVERMAKMGEPTGYIVRDGEWVVGEGARWDAAGRDHPLSDDFPAINLTWDDGNELCRLLSDRSANGWNYRLPTVAEWEYACRAGHTTRFYSGDDEDGLFSYAIYGTNFPSRVKGRRRPNAWGLWDMSGNLLEWCADAAPGSDDRVLCGGKFNDPASVVNCGARMTEHRHSPLGGIRLVAERRRKDR